MFSALSRRIGALQIFIIMIIIIVIIIINVESVSQVILTIINVPVIYFCHLSDGQNERMKS